MITVSNVASNPRRLRVESDGWSPARGAFMQGALTFRATCPARWLDGHSNIDCADIVLWAIKERDPAVHVERKPAYIQ